MTSVVIRIASVAVNLTSVVKYLGPLLGRKWLWRPWFVTLVVIRMASVAADLTLVVK